MRNATRFGRILAALLLLAGAGPSASSPPGPSSGGSLSKLDSTLQRRLSRPSGRSRVILTTADGAPADAIGKLVRLAGGKAGRPLRSIGGQVADLPNGALRALAAHPHIAHISEDRLTAGAMERTAATIGASVVRESLGYDGAGVGVAVIDSGVSASHDDLTAPGAGSGVVRFVDFVNGATTAYDDYGHGTHVAGIVAGNGFDSNGARSGIAPGAHLIVLKTLDQNGHGRISDVIAALDYVIDNKDALNIRVVNLSVATGVYESYNTDPLTLAARRVVESGIVVVAAAGNNGRNQLGDVHYGGITAPGNAPWVLTVGASSHMGTTDRADDTVASFSSRGPAAIDYAAKPDVVAPGVGIESLTDPDSTLYSTRAAYLLPGAFPTAYQPYLSLSGTSMAAPVVSGTVALMLQANPSLTPNEVKAILQYTAEARPGSNALSRGAGFLNAKGAVELALYLASPSTAAYPDSTAWSERLIWGNRLIRGGRLMPDANAWANDVMWGAPQTPAGESIEWGGLCRRGCDTFTGAWRLDSAVLPRNVVWGTSCGGADCQTTWSPSLVSSTMDDEDTVVWGTFDDGDTVVWGTSDEGDTVVWGTSCTDSACEPVIWKRP